MSNQSQWCFCWLADNPYASGKAKAALVKASMWTPGAIIRIAFLDGMPNIRLRVRHEAQKWTTEFGGPANLTFLFVGDPQEADIRISFQRGGSWSVLGTTCQLLTPKSAPTMNFGWLDADSTNDEVSRVVLHEVGHALGLIHEHLSPHANIPWDKPAVYRDLKGPPNNWDEARIDHNMFNAVPAYMINASPFDNDSIMIYPIPAHWTTTGLSTSLNSTLSARDIAFVRSHYS